MTQEEKQLLIKDLCARVPYGVIVDYKENEFEAPHWKITAIYPDTFDGRIGYDKRVGAGYESGSRPFKIGEVKPYLRHMSSMTEEEKEEFEKISHCFLKTIVLKRDKKLRIVEQKTYFDNEIPSSGAFGDDGDYRYIKQEYFVNLIDWLIAHHFDYRGLIEKGLALEAPEGMYK